MLHINMSSQVTKCVDTRLCSVPMHTYEHVSQMTHSCGNVVVGIKHRKLCDKLHTYTSSYVKICTWRRPCKSKWRREASF